MCLIDEYLRNEAVSNPVSTIDNGSHKPQWRVETRPVWDVPLPNSVTTDNDTTDNYTYGRYPQKRNQYLGGGNIPNDDNLVNELSVADLHADKGSLNSDEPDIELDTVNVYPTKIPKFLKWWNKAFRSMDGYYEWADRYAEKHPNAANTLIINPDKHTITNSRDKEHSSAEQFSPVEQPDIIDSEGNVIYPLDFPVPPENSFFPPMNVRPWSDKTVIDKYNQWKENERRAYRQKLAEEEARIIEEYGYPICDRDGYIIGFSQTPLPQEKPLSGTDPIGEFYVAGEVLGPLFTLLGRGTQQLMARAGNQWARNQIGGRAFNNAANATFGFDGTKAVNGLNSSLLYKGEQPRNGLIIKPEKSNNEVFLHPDGYLAPKPKAKKASYGTMDSNTFLQKWYDVTDNPTDNLLKLLGRPYGYKTSEPFNINLLNAEYRKMVEELSKGGVDVSRLGVEDLRALKKIRLDEIEKTAPERYTMAIPKSMNEGSGYELSDRLAGEEVGTATIYLDAEKNAHISWIENKSPIGADGKHTVGGVQENGLNSAIQAARSEGGKGVITGQHYLAAPYQYHTVQKFKNRRVVGNDGFHTNKRIISETANVDNTVAKTMLDMARAGNTELKELENAPYWLLSSGTHVVPTKTVPFNPSIIDKYGSMHIGWSDPSIFKGFAPLMFIGRTIDDIKQNK